MSDRQGFRKTANEHADAEDFIAAAYKRIASKQELLTPEEWCERTGIQIFDPDGWRNPGDDWYRPVTREEFIERARDCTVMRWPRPLLDEIPPSDPHESATDTGAGKAEAASEDRVTTLGEYGGSPSTVSIPRDIVEKAIRFAADIGGPAWDLTEEWCKPIADLARYVEDYDD